MLLKKATFKHDLQALTTFAVPAFAERLEKIETSAQLQTLIASGEKINLILGGGSNILFTHNPKGLVVQNLIKGRELIRESGDDVWLRFGGGENWHEVVSWSLENGYFGLENLSLIPGTVGAAPIQNIGAYGVELKDHFAWLEAVDLKTGDAHHFESEACQFGYRYSVFKGPLKGRYMITHVVLKLSRQARLKLEYGAIRTTLEEMQVENPQAADVSRAVIHIRQSKLPDPKELGNAGSFFKNPQILVDQYNSLRKTYPNMPAYPIDEKRVKVPAGWLIEKAGWKGKRIGNTGCHARQSLVIVNSASAWKERSMSSD
ncbi:MAG: UDP-N-acetylmuramate dehydrogenase [Bacteroidetes bacterium]|nr:UDP-N-acetylmuramate dehydrogenase [Bacteroidota bacterium]